MPKVTDLADPHRCNAITPNGQCLNLAVEGTQKCEGHTRTRKELAPRLKQYLLTGEGEADRIAQLADSETVKSLRETAAIAIRVLERRYNLIKTDTEFLANSGAIDRDLKTIEKIVKSLVELDERTGFVMSREQLIIIFQSLATIVREEIMDIDGWEERMDRITERFAPLITKKRPPALPNET